MFKPLSLFLAFRYIRARQVGGFASFISASSTIGIALGVMVLIIVLSAMNGFERALADRLLSIIPHGEVIAVNEPIVNWRDKAKKIITHPDVIASAPVIKLNGMIQHKAELKSLEIRGVDQTLEQQVSAITDYLIAGQWDTLYSSTDPSQSQGIIIGSGIAKKLGVSLGDKIQLLLPASDINQGLSVKFPTPKKHNLMVAGIFKFGGIVDDNLAYISLAKAQDIKQLSPEQVDGIRVKVSKVFNAPSITRDVAYSFDHYVYIHDWTRTQGHLYNDIQLVRMVMFIVMVLVIAVASFNIVSTLIMVVNEKRGDIAILKTMGAAPSTVMIAFVIQGMMNGFIGSLSGGILGVIIALNLTEIFAAIETFFGVTFLSGDVYFIDYLPTQLVQSDVIATIVVALIMSTLATIYPAWRATKVEPAAVLGQI
ncbi:lipoprotein-releasing ABC transporter permease subunit LolE [Thalassotalea atypica]|uniref:lipoprotein-releasing ABC transporter permease subunit LolE n=1 Tax=Thalassotalea atypica TaxID=2054316 RepID=UPI00257484C4|nr:lipoprotein-releasing ABC transporter permease subunit LolE [Thalassotalea atypica]